MGTLCHRTAALSIGLLVLSQCIVGASAILCYQCTGCDAEYESSATTCEGDTCMWATGVLDGNAYDTRMCLKSVPGIQMGCVNEQSGDNEGTLCYCNDKDLCNAAASLTSTIFLSGTAIAVLVKMVLL